MSSAPAYRIALLIPNYWDGLQIRDTLESVQESEPIEVIVVDDATPDRSAVELLRAYERDGLVTRLIVLDTNVGASSAVNVAAKAATAPYLVTFANDDLLLPGALGALADALDADPTMSFAVGGLEFFGARTGVHHPKPWDPWRALTRCAWTPSLMIRREVFESLGGLTTECRSQDWDLYLGLAGAGHRGIVLQRTIYRYRVHEMGHRESSRAQKGFRKEIRTIRSRHQVLFARERELRRASTASMGEKIIWTFILKANPYRPPFVTYAAFRLASAVTRMRAYSTRIRARYTRKRIA